MKKIKILIADDHSIMRMGLSTLITCKKDMELVGEADNGKTAVEKIRELKPDVVIMDLMMPELGGADATKIVSEEMPDIKVIILTSFGTSADLSQAIANGASGVIMKDSATDDLIMAIRTVANGDTFIPPELLRMAEEDASALQLTDHQRIILTHVTRGLSNADIAKLLSVSEPTIKKTLWKIFGKIGAANRAEAATIALRKNLVSV